MDEQNAKSRAHKHTHTHTHAHITSHERVIAIPHGPEQDRQARNDAFADTLQVRLVVATAQSRVDRPHAVVQLRAGRATERERGPTCWHFESEIQVLALEREKEVFELRKKERERERERDGIVSIDTEMEVSALTEDTMRTEWLHHTLNGTHACGNPSIRTSCRASADNVSRTA